MVFGVILLYLALLRAVRKPYHFPAPAFIGRSLDSDRRRWLQSPDRTIERSGIKEGMTVVDLGCGSGAFTPFVAAPGESRAKFMPLISNYRCFSS